MNNGHFLVTGKVSIDNYYYCSTARISSNMCGENATKYEEN
jgi:bifunctional ADP-heptose synthase (sugar kinase/adenylyltransferase)